MSDTYRVARQHYPRHELCDAFDMTPGDRLKQIRSEAGLTVEALAKRTGMAASTIRAHENGQNGIKAPVASQYASALGVAPELILFGDGRQIDRTSNRAAEKGVRRVPVLGVVQAGAWAEVFDDSPHPTEYIVFDEPEYARTEVFALVVRGPSTDLVYPDGTRIICIPAGDGGIREGDFVVVRRRRGAFAETTLKQIQIGDDGGVELWPRSSDPAFQEPIRIRAARDPDDSPEIIAVVVGRYDVGRAGRGPLIQFN